jgi:hypothetical protein
MRSLSSYGIRLEQKIQQQKQKLHLLQYGLLLNEDLKPFEKQFAPFFSNSINNEYQ